MLQTIRNTGEFISQEDGISFGDYFVQHGSAFPTSDVGIGMAHHVLTLDDNIVQGRVLDNGCGSGLLGITASTRLGVQEIFFHDVCPKSLATTRKNIIQNDITLRGSLQYERLYLQDEGYLQNLGVMLMIFLKTHDSELNTI